jgi:ABC-type oligopeptide transport system ATPase subunit
MVAASNIPPENPFTRAVREQIKLKMGIVGPSGSGKTWTALMLAQHIAGAGGKVALIGTEPGAARKYANHFTFDEVELTNYHPDSFIAAINAAVHYGYDILVIDSLSDEWDNTGGILDIVNTAEKRQTKNSNKFAAWGDATPLHNAFLQAITSSNIHVIGTMRAKTEYVMEEYTDRSGRKKTKPVKVGLKPVQRDGIDYELDVIGEMDTDNTMTISKTRCTELHGAVIQRPGAELATALKAWVDGGEVPQPRPGPIISSNVTQQPQQPAGGWATEAELHKLGGHVAARTKQKLSAAQIAALAGITDFGDTAAWNAKYPTYVDAGKAIMAAWDKQHNIPTPEAAAQPAAEPFDWNANKERTAFVTDLEYDGKTITFNTDKGTVYCPNKTEFKRIAEASPDEILAALHPPFTEWKAGTHAKISYTNGALRIGWDNQTDGTTDAAGNLTTTARTLVAMQQGDIPF